ncbi:MAG: HupE/UreJ family protein [Cyanobacteria bacterium P01_D01_bin.44]
MQKALHYLRLTLLSFLGALIFTGIYAPLASAHWADLAVADIVVEDTLLQMTLTIPTGLVEFADDDGDGMIATAELEKYQAQLEDYFRDRIVVTAAQQTPARLTLTAESSTPSAPERAAHSTFLLQYTGDSFKEGLSLRYGLFPPEMPNAQCLTTILADGNTHNFVFTPTNPVFTLSQSPLWQAQFASFLKLGIEHIFTGYDHILFLVALLLPGGTLLHLVKIVTAFTLAHSLTLSLAVLNIVTLPTALVESLIALSIIYVAIDNLWLKRLQHRWGITFVFGLIHGLGFANILRDLTETQGNLVLSLASFNLGVELGQIGIVIITFLGLQTLGHYRWSWHLQQVISVGLILVGSLWFAERTLAALPIS